jgi:sulfatase maturation enzyme AslB (radical SAM superfamily)
MLVAGEEVFFINYQADQSKTILYSPLRSYLGLLKTAALGDFLKEGSATRRLVLERLKTKPLIDPERILKETQDHNPELSLALTDNCNLRCRYCHASAGDPGKAKSMTVALVDSIVEKYFQQIRKSEKDDSIRISFSGGGEPTVNFSLLKHAIKRCKDHAAAKGMRCWFGMATNGCYGNNVRQYIFENFHNISLSFDGPAHIHNRHRPHKDGSGSFDAVFETAKYFHRNDFPFAMRATVSDYSIEYLEEIIDFISSELPGSQIGFEPLLPVGRARKNLDLRPPEDHQYAKRMVEIIDYAKGKEIRRRGQNH